LGFGAPASSTDDAGDITPQIEAIAAIDADPAFGAYLSTQCTACHSSSGDGRIPPLNGMPANDMIGALLEFKLGLRENEVMRSVAAGMADEDIAALALHFDQQEPNDR
jgi:cytochrome c553